MSGTRAQPFSTATAKSCLPPPASTTTSLRRISLPVLLLGLFLRDLLVDGVHQPRRDESPLLRGEDARELLHLLLGEAPGEVLEQRGVGRRLREDLLPGDAVHHGREQREDLLPVACALLSLAQLHLAVVVLGHALEEHLLREVDCVELLLLGRRDPVRLRLHRPLEDREDRDGVLTRHAFLRLEVTHELRELSGRRRRLRGDPVVLRVARLAERVERLRPLVVVVERHHLELLGLRDAAREGLRRGFEQLREVLRLPLTGADLDRLELDLLPASHVDEREARTLLDSVEVLLVADEQALRDELA